MTVSNKPTLSNEQKIYLLTEIQSKIKEIIAKNIQPVESWDANGDFYEEDFYCESSFELQFQLNKILIETIL
jgi:uncharacterized protein (UPF0371 family)